MSTKKVGALILEKKGNGRGSPHYYLINKENTEKKEY